MNDSLHDSTEQRLVKQIEEVIDMDFVIAFAGERALTARDKAKMDSVIAQRGEQIYHDLLFILTMQDYPAPDAKRIWHSIVQHKQQLTQKLARNPGLVVAALDYLTNLEETCTTNFTIVAEDYFDTIVQRAAVDSLTNLYDHHTFYSILEQEINRANRYSQKLSLLMIDIDDFKSVNDEHGHQLGDAVLINVATIIANSLRKMDTCGRYGGEEFSVILPQADAGYAASIGERIRSSIAAAEVEGIAVTVSIGVACFPVDGGNIAQLIQQSDAALYRGKETGKNCVVISDQHKN